MRPNPTDVLRRWSALLNLLLLVAFAGVLSVGLPSCGGGDDEEDTRSSRRSRSGSSSEEDVDEEESGGLSAAKRKAEGYLEEATKVGADKLLSGDFQTAEAALEKAARLRRDGEIEDAERQYGVASRKFRTLLREVEEIQTARKEVEALKAEVDASKTKAEKAEAQANAARAYKDAADLYGEAVALLAKNDVESIKSARGKLSAARDYFEDAAELAARNAIQKERAVKEKERLTTYKEKAREAGADTKEISLWQRAESEEIRGDTNMKQGDFEYAVQAYQSATQQYTAALERVVEEAELAKFLEEQQKKREELAMKLAQQAATQGTAQDPGIGVPIAPPDPSVNIPPVPVPVPGPTGSGSAEIIAGPSCYCLPDAYDPSNYPQQLDDVDEAFLLEHYTSLSKYLQYDPTTGCATLDYSDGQRLKDEAKQKNLMGNISNCRYEDLMLAGQKPTDPAAWISFEGHTSGFMILPAPFRYRAHVSYEMNLGLMDATGAFGANLMVDPKKKNWLGTNWVHLQMVQGGRARGGKAMPGDFRQSANYWFPKTRPVQMVTEYLTTDAKKESGEFTHTYDVADTNLANKTSTKGYTRGFVALQWSRVKFRLRNLKVCGLLDKEMAVAMLRQKLNIPKPAKSAEDPPPDPGGDENGATEGAAEDAEEGSEGSGETAEGAGEEGAKKDGDFDF